MKEKMYKIIPKVLFCINTLIVVALIIGSSIMIYFSTSEQKSIFGHTALLYSSFNENNEETHSLYIVKTDSAVANVKVGDEIAFMTFNSDWETIPFVDTVKSITGSIIDFEHSPLILQQDTEDFIGKVTTKNEKLGESLYEFIQSKSALTAYVAIGAGFIVCSLVVILLFAIRVRRDAVSRAESRFETIGDIEEVIYENDHQPLTVTDDEDDDIIDLKQTTLELPDMTLQTSEVVIILGGDIIVKPPQQKDIELTLPKHIENVEDSPPTPRSSEIEAYLDEIIKQAQREFEETYKIK